MTLRQEQGRAVITDGLSDGNAVQPICLAKQASFQAIMMHRQKRYIRLYDLLSTCCSLVSVSSL